jgi:hypothetical protein
MMKIINVIQVMTCLAIGLICACSNPEKPKVMATIDQFGKSIEATQLKLESVTDSVPGKVIIITKEIEKNLRDSVKKYTANISASFQAAKFSENDNKEGNNKLNEVILKENELMKKVLSKKIEAFISNLERSKADLTNDLKKNQFPALAGMQKETIKDLENSIVKLKERMAEQIDSLKKEVESLSSTKGEDKK